MSLVNAEELEARGINCRTASELIYQGRLLVRQNTFSAASRQQAVETCERHLMAGRFCILVVDATSFTLWLDSKHIDYQTKAIPQLRPKKAPLTFRGRPLD